MQILFSLQLILQSYPNFHPTYRIRKLIELHENFTETLEDTALMIQTLRTRYLTSNYPYDRTILCCYRIAATAMLP